MLRDTQGVTASHAALPMELVPIVARFTGAMTCTEIAEHASKELGETIGVEIVVRLATELEDALFVHGAPYDRARARIEATFAEADVREASHAGGAYHGEAKKLAAYIDEACLALASGRARHGAKATTPGTNGTPPNGVGGPLVALVAPHIDPWRGARCYGEAYATLDAHLPADVDTFILFGTSHAPMREPFTLCRKAFATPLGPMEADLDAIDRIAAACDFDPYADQFNHKREHSLEFQAVFLRHLFGPRKARIVPILAGLGAQQNSGETPKGTRAIERFYDAVRAVVDDTRAVVIAGADLAHVGPRFGDPKPYAEGERATLDTTDRASLERATAVDAEAFWEHVSQDLDVRRVCGLAPIYSLLRTIAPKAKGVVRHYEQTIDAEEGSIVSHAAVGFHL